MPHFAYQNTQYCQMITT